MQNIKQITVAHGLGEDWNQKKISLLEDKEEIPEDILERLAPLLNVSPDIIKNFDSEATQPIFATNNNHGNASSAAVVYQCTFNPLDKLVAAYEANKEVYEANKDLYQQLLAAEKEKSVMLEKMNAMLQASLKKYEVEG